MDKDKFYKLAGAYRMDIHNIHRQFLKIYERAVSLSQAKPRQAGNGDDLPRHARCLEELQRSLEILSRQASHVDYEMALSEPEVLPRKLPSPPDIPLESLELTPASDSPSSWRIHPEQLAFLELTPKESL